MCERLISTQAGKHRRYLQIFADNMEPAATDSINKATLSSQLAAKILSLRECWRHTSNIMLK